jgi:2-phosphoglycerate kinase
VLDDDVRIIEDGDLSPFSKGLMARSLMATGLPPERAYEVAAAMERRMRRRGSAALTLTDLREVSRRSLGQREGEALIERYRQWRTLRAMEKPLVVLIGGATGVGKSTLATQLANRLGITRVVSTDMVRQVMRAFFAAELMPAIHFSSFDAASAVRVTLPRETDLSKVGFVEQTKAVTVGTEALIERGITEGKTMVVEGVHIVPGILDRSKWGEAVVLEFVLAVKDRDVHRGHFAVRDWETAGVRPLRRYIEHFAEIRRIQKYILGRADEYGVPVIDNVGLEEVLSDVLGMVLRRVQEYQAAT